MRCDEVVRELAAPTGNGEPAALAEHLAGCPACAEWARRAALLDRLWEATRPPEPSPEVWGSVWAHISQSLDSSATPEMESPSPARVSRNGTSSHSKILTHPASPPPSTRSRIWRPGAIALVVLAQAAAVLIAVGLAWHDSSSSHKKPQTTQIVQDDHSPPGRGPSAVKVASPVTIEADIAEGHRIVIHADGPAPRVVDVTPEEMFYAIEGGSFTWKVVCRPSISPESMFYTVKVAKPVSQLEDPWYAMFNLAESFDQQMIASR